MINELVKLISEHVVASLAEAHYPLLADGEVLLGEEHVDANSSPPRIIFYPFSGSTDAKDVYGDEHHRQAMNLNPSFMTEVITFKVHCWGTSEGCSAREEFDFTQALYHQVWRSCDALFRGSWEATQMGWTGARSSAARQERFGREMVFLLSVDTPVLTKLRPLEYAPCGVHAWKEVALRLPNGRHEIGHSDKEER